MPRMLVIVVVLGACGEPAKDAGSPPGKSLADGAIDAVTEYQRKSMSGEARTYVMSIARGAVTVFEETGRLPPSAPMTPEAGVCCKQPGGKCPIGFAQWDHPSWQAVFFQLDNPHYYSYALDTKPDGFVVRAVGDLDCDATLSTFELPAAVIDGKVQLGELAISDALE